MGEGSNGTEQLYIHFTSAAFPRSIPSGKGMEYGNGEC